MKDNVVINARVNNESEIIKHNFEYLLQVNLQACHKIIKQ